MEFVDRILMPPSYGWTCPKGEFVKPTSGQIFKEFFHRLNIFRSKKQWLAVTSWLAVLITFPAVILFVVNYFTWWYALAGFAYGMIVMGTHGTIWYHRYSTHKAYVFKNNFWRFVTRNLVPAMIPEEIYVISHHVHHIKSDTPGDPYYAKGGWLYCFLADVNHQLISTDLTEKEYKLVANMLEHTGAKLNTYEQYKKYGSVSNPLRTFLRMLVTIGFWFTVHYLLFGPALALAFMSGTCLWAVGVRTFNYDGHGRGEDKRKEGVDYNRKDFSINQYWPGFVAGEWHNNHHLYPASARSGFLKHQLDLAWVYIKTLHIIGGVKSYHDSKAKFMRDYHHAKEKTSLITEEKEQMRSAVN